MEDLIKQYSLTVMRWRSSKQTIAAAHGMEASGNKYNYLTRKGIFRYLWMNMQNLLPNTMQIYGKSILFYGLWTMGLEKDNMAMENADLSPLSNGFVQ